MKVDFNNLRRCAVAEYNELVRRLNNHIVNGNYVNVPIEDIEEILDDLRMSIATIALTHDDGNDEFVDVLGNGVLILFNKEDEEG